MAAVSSVGCGLATSVGWEFSDVPVSSVECKLVAPVRSRFIDVPGSFVG